MTSTIAVLHDIDVREVKGTYLVTTMSGRHYTIVADADPDGIATVSGGKLGVEPHDTVIGNRELKDHPEADPVIRFNQRIFTSLGGHLDLVSTGVCFIRCIDGLTADQIEELKAIDRAAKAAATSNSPAWWSDLVPADW